MNKISFCSIHRNIEPHQHDAIYIDKKFEKDNKYFNLLCHFPTDEITLSEEVREKKECIKIEPKTQGDRGFLTLAKINAALKTVGIPTYFEIDAPCARRLNPKDKNQVENALAILA